MRLFVLLLVSIMTVACVRAKPCIKTVIVETPTEIVNETFGVKDPDGRWHYVSVPRTYPAHKDIVCVDPYKAN